MEMRNHGAWLLLFMSLSHTLVSGLENGLARTPPMGWLAWERFKCTVDCKTNKDNCISEDLFMQMADHIVKDGFKDVGYTYVNIDDCWLSKYRDPKGQLIADPERFPRGIKFLANYMHSRGLKLGIYQDFGKRTCMGYPGIVGHMEEDANIFARWNVDMVKLDGCHSSPNDMDKGYTLMGKFLNQTGRPMVFSCSWPYYQLVQGMEPNYKLIAQHCNLWRVFNDIADSWENIQSVIDFFGDNQEVLTQHVGPGHWTDPDMLVIGNFHLTYEQARIQMSIWAILPAPLLMSNDLRRIKPEFRELLKNKNVIAINQDPLGLPGKRIYQKDGIEVWKRPITPVFKREKSYVLLVLSRREEKIPIGVTILLEQFGLNYTGGYHLTELYSNNDFGAVSSSFSLALKLTGIDSVMLKAEVLNKSKHLNGNKTW